MVEQMAWSFGARLFFHRSYMFPGTNLFSTSTRPTKVRSWKHLKRHETATGTRLVAT